MGYGYVTTIKDINAFMKAVARIMKWDYVPVSAGSDAVGTLSHEGIRLDVKAIDAVKGVYRIVSGVPTGTDTPAPFIRITHHCGPIHVVRSIERSLLHSIQRTMQDAAQAQYIDGMKTSDPNKLVIRSIADLGSALGIADYNSASQPSKISDAFKEITDNAGTLAATRLAVTIIAHSPEPSIKETLVYPFTWQAFISTWGGMLDARYALSREAVGSEEE